MITQYPHTIQVKRPGSSTRDAQGNWVETAESSFTGKGRYETANSRNSSVISLSDGRQIQPSGIIYMPLSFTTVSLEDEVTVLDGSSEIAKGKIIRHSRGQLNARIWL